MALPLSQWILSWLSSASYASSGYVPFNQSRILIPSRMWLPPSHYGACVGSQSKVLPVLNCFPSQLATPFPWLSSSCLFSLPSRPGLIPLWGGLSSLGVFIRPVPPHPSRPVQVSLWVFCLCLLEAGLRIHFASISSQLWSENPA